MKTYKLATLAVLLISAAVVLMAEERGSFDRTLNVSGPVELSAQSGAGHIHIHSGPAGKVAVHGEIRANWGDAAEKVRRLEQNPPIEQNGNHIRIGNITDEFLKHDVSISYDITVPAETNAEAHTGAGGIEVSGIKGPIKVHTGSGEIHLSDIANDATAHTGTGSITLEDVGAVSAHTGSGGIRGKAL
jgi:hypothetical protein